MKLTFHPEFIFFKHLFIIVNEIINFISNSTFIGTSKNDR